jgi:hypothetical protein
MQQDQPDQDYFTSADRRKRTLKIMVAHLLIAATFFIATFMWGNFE